MKAILHCVSVEHTIPCISSMLHSNVKSAIFISVSILFLLGVSSYLLLFDFLVLVQNLGRLLTTRLRAFSSFAESIFTPRFVYVGDWGTEMFGAG